MKEIEIDFRVAAPHEAAMLLGGAILTPTLAALVARERAVLAIVDGEPAALAIYTCDEIAVEIQAIAVAPDLRGRGIGRALVAYLRGSGGRVVRALVSAAPSELAPMFGVLGSVGATYFGYSLSLPTAERLAGELDVTAAISARPIQLASDIGGLLELDALSGRPRDPALHDALQSLAQGLLFSRPDGESAAYLYVAPDGAIALGAAVSAATLGDAILYACARLRSVGRDLARLRVPAASARLARLLRRCGGSIVEVSVLLGDATEARALDLPLCGMLRGEPAGRSSAW
ncbi:MAG: GNAT family N-acetyltransferase [Candidatus Eremiobacteraeota bacterium]|nr:GNAT family N-acetyltransferase [Candidatus Eremiobacteraeota bacterium]